MKRDYSCSLTDYTRIVKRDKLIEIIQFQTNDLHIILESLLYLIFAQYMNTFDIIDGNLNKSANFQISGIFHAHTHCNVTKFTLYRYKYGS